ncbi:MAG: hypothetical protein AAB131_09110 [Actinomycetota bacterium]
MARPEFFSNDGIEGTERPADNYAAAYAVDGPLADCWVHTVHDPLVALTVGGNNIDGEVVYRFSVEEGRPTLRLASDASPHRD